MKNKKFYLFFLVIMLAVLLTGFSFKLYNNYVNEELSKVSITQSLYAENNKVISKFHIVNNSKYNISVYYKDSKQDDYILLTFLSDGSSESPYYINSGGIEDVGYSIDCVDNSTAESNVKELVASNHYVLLLTDNKKQKEIIVKPN